MANTAVVTSTADKVLAGRPFTAKVALSLDAGVVVKGIVPTVSAGCAEVSIPSGTELYWTVNVFGVPTGAPEVSIGATVYTSAGTVEATVAKVQCVVPGTEEGLAWFNTFEQSGLIPAVVL